MPADLVNRWRCHWRRKNKYETFDGWLLESYQRLMGKYPSIWLPGRGRVITVKLRGHDEPFHVRLGSSDWLVLNEIFEDDEYGPLLRHQLGSVQQIVDLGANIGLSVRLWQKHFPHANVLAVEPDDGNLALLHRNTPRDTEGRVTAVRACVAGHERIVQLDHNASAWAIAMHEVQEGCEVLDGVEAKTILQLLDDAGIVGDIDLLKCDVEGAEREVFAGAFAFLGRVRNAIIEVHPPYQPSDLVRDVQATGLNFKIFAPEDRDENQVVMLFKASS